MTYFFDAYREAGLRPPVRVPFTGRFAYREAGLRPPVRVPFTGRFAYREAGLRPPVRKATAEDLHPFAVGRQRYGGYFLVIRAIHICERKAAKALVVLLPYVTVSGKASGVGHVGVESWTTFE